MFPIDETLTFFDAINELRYVATALSSYQPVIRGHDDKYRCSFCYQERAGDLTKPLLHRGTCEWYQAVNLFNRMGLAYRKVQKMDDKENRHEKAV